MRIAYRASAATNASVSSGWIRCPGNTPASGPGGLNPFQLLGAALDRMVDAGVLPAARRPGAEFLAWSAVHGLALLLIDGPLRGLPGAQVEALAQRLLDMVEQGI